MAYFMISSVSRPPRRKSALARAFAEKVCQQLWLWHERMRQRAALASLDARLLEDVGIGREQARQETEKPFWL